MADVVRDGLAELARLPAAALALVPTTTRTVRQVERIGLPFTPRFLIASSGGVVLENGHVDQAWAEDDRPPSRGVRAGRRGPCGSRRAGRRRDRAARPHRRRPVLLRHRRPRAVHPRARRGAHGLARPAVVAGGPSGGQGLRAARRAAQGARHRPRPGPPDPRARARSRPCWPAGDTWLDAEMLEAADRGWVPAGSEIASSGTPPWPHVTVTDAPGHAAAAQIVGAWAARVCGVPTGAGGRSDVVRRPHGGPGTMPGMTTMSKGSNLPVPAARVRATLGWSSDVEVDASGLLLTSSGRVRSDDDFVFYNQPRSADGSVRHTGGAAREDSVEVDLTALPGDDRAGRRRGQRRERHVRADPRTAPAVDRCGEQRRDRAVRHRRCHDGDGVPLRRALPPERAVEVPGRRAGLRLGPRRAGHRFRDQRGRRARGHSRSPGAVLGAPRGLDRGRRSSAPWAAGAARPCR